MLDPHLADIERWLAVEPRLTALAILGRLTKRCPGQFGPPQQTIVQRLLKALRRQAAASLIAETITGAAEAGKLAAGGGGLRSGCALPPSCHHRPVATCRTVHQAISTTPSVTFLREAIRGSKFRAD